MNQLIGFAVLTGPLFLIVLWVPICIGLGIWVGRKFIKKGTPVKVAGGVLVFLVALILPVSDEIAGRIYFNHLCKTEAGVKVYQTIELPTKYWDKDGKPKFLNSRGVWDKSILGDRFEWKRETEPVVSNFIRIERKKWVFHDNKNHQNLGEMIDFMRYFGWLNAFSPAPNVGEGCKNMWEGESSQRNFMLQVFTKPVSKSGVENGNN